MAGILAPLASMNCIAEHSYRPAGIMSRRHGAANQGPRPTGSVFENKPYQDFSEITISRQSRLVFQA
jgi:hypothetical protein